MNKLEMAHEWAMKIIEGNVRAADASDLLGRAWQYADLMQAEADKPEEVEREQKRKEIRELLNADNTFLEKEGRHFDDVEWQPGWSQAPDWANFIVMSKAGTSYWHANEPKASGNGWVGSGLCDLAYMDFYHKGDWRSSLRKRP